MNHPLFFFFLTKCWSPLQKKWGDSKNDTTIKKEKSNNTHKKKKKMSDILDFTGPNTLPEYLYRSCGKRNPEGQRSIAQGKSRFNRPVEYLSSGANVEDFADFNVYPKCTAEETIELLNKLYERYIPSTGVEQDTIRKRAYELWGLDPNARVSYERIDEEYKRSLFQILQVYQLLLEYNLIGTKNQQSILNQRNLAKVFEVVYYQHELLIAEQKWVGMSDPGEDARVPDEIQLFKFSPFDYARNNPFQNLLIYVLRQLYAKQYRRLGSDCYKQVKTEQGMNTHSWKKVCSVREFVNKHVQKETNYEMWLALTASNHTDVRVTDYLIQHEDVEFPVLVVDRHLFAFRNGLLRLGGFIDVTKPKTEENLRDPSFHPYEEPIPESEVACKYFDEELSPEYFNRGIYEDWYTIPTPHFEKIMEDQKIPDKDIQFSDKTKYNLENPREMMYIMSGRMCYEVGQYDNWQVIPFIEGIANTGKSTILKVINRFFNMENVGIMASNMQPQFWASSLYDKFIFLCYETRHDFAIPQGEFQSAVSGDEMCIQIKFKTALSLRWVTPGFMAGNQVPNYVDASGSMTRRLVVFNFSQKVGKVDPGLLDKLFSEVPALLVKCNYAYLSAVLEFGNRPVWEWWGPYFQRTSDQIKSQVRPITKFLQGKGSELYFRDRRAYMMMEEFRDAFNQDYRQSEGKPPPRWTQSLYGIVFEEEGIRATLAEKLKYRTEDDKIIEDSYRWLVGIGRIDNKKFFEDLAREQDAALLEEEQRKAAAVD
jgi:hypothetical protein